MEGIEIWLCTPFAAGMLPGSRTDTGAARQHAGPLSTEAQVPTRVWRVPPNSPLSLDLVSPVLSGRDPAMTCVLDEFWSGWQPGRPRGDLAEQMNHDYPCCEEQVEKQGSCLSWPQLGRAFGASGLSTHFGGQPFPSLLHKRARLCPGPRLSPAPTFTYFL